FTTLQSQLSILLINLYVNFFFVRMRNLSGFDEASGDFSLQQLVKFNRLGYTSFDIIISIFVHKYTCDVLV
ncbi:hypothetical protein, partial [Membranihabitans maritimus]|uniref:hypothetical protein n=1 Tax=Membranihabitans maritimus TaxID=2904244 RepID=UPI001F3028D9